MPGSLLSRALRRSASDVPYSLFLVTVAVCLFRVRDLPSVDVAAGAAHLSLGPADLGLSVTAAVAAWRLLGRRCVPPLGLLAAAAFALLVVATSIPNGADAVASGGRLTELAALTLGAVAFVDRRERMETMMVMIVAFCVAATGWALFEFALDGGRQASFLGEHDLAALATMTASVGLAMAFTRSGRLPRLAVLALVTGALGIVLGASLASLLGLYLASGAALALAWLRGDLRRGAVVLTTVLCAVVTAGTLAMRSDELGFLQSWFGPPPDTPGQYAASWSQRLIYVYIGGRVFLDRPVLGTGWQGELPPSDFAVYLPAAHRRFDDQPTHYFPSESGTLIPQQAYDQMLVQLGVIGALLFLAVVGVMARHALVAGRRWQRLGFGDEQAYIPAAWVGSTVGAIAGAALFGGSPLTALFWITVGVAAAAPALARSAGSP